MAVQCLSPFFVTSFVGYLALSIFVTDSSAYIPEERDQIKNQVVAIEQLPDYAKTHPDGSSQVVTDDVGRPLPSLLASQTVSQEGTILLTDSSLMQIIAGFDRELIPERTLHANGAGAHGYFEVTTDIGRKYSKASFLSQKGKKTPVFVRFSTAIGERGSPDTVVNSFRGFAVKFYTDDGNWDLAGLNFPIISRDPIQQVSVAHAFKRNPQTHLYDFNAIWDILSLSPHLTHLTLHLFSDLGSPDGYRHIHGHGVMTYKLVNDQGESVFCKFHYLTRQGLKNLTHAEAAKLAGFKTEYATIDLYNNIAQGNYPAWDFYIQTMTAEQAAAAPFDPFDDTFEWYEEDYPLQKVGHFILNRNPGNYFDEVEQVAFNPGSLIPGIEESPDWMFAGRAFLYPDTQRHRLGKNFNQLPINSPRVPVHNYNRDGMGARFQGERGQPYYYPNTFQGPRTPEDRTKVAETPWAVSGVVDRYQSNKSNNNTGKVNGSDKDGDINFVQPRRFWHKMDQAAQSRFVEHVVETLALVTYPPIVDRVFKMFDRVDTKLGNMVRNSLKNKSSSSNNNRK